MNRYWDLRSQGSRCKGFGCVLAQACLTASCSHPETERSNPVGLGFRSIGFETKHVGGCLIRVLFEVPKKVRHPYLNSTLKGILI